MMVRGASGHSNKMSSWVVSQKFSAFVPCGAEAFSFSIDHQEIFFLKEKEK